ncbi:hypothetical protein ACE6H2_004546 [Prunus campanulata]
MAMKPVRCLRNPWRLRNIKQSRRICLRFSTGIYCLPTPIMGILPRLEGCRVVFLSAATIEEVLLRRTGYTVIRPQPRSWTSSKE